MYKYIEVRRHRHDEPVSRREVSLKSERVIESIQDRMNIDLDEFYTEVVEEEIELQEFNNW